jgi:uncharacterized protein YndB with AHSA1/START domain
MTNPVVDESTTVDAPAHRVWQAIVDPRARSGWWGYLDLDARVGGRFEERWVDADGRKKLTHGHVVDLVPERMLRLSWADEDWPAQTEVELRLDQNEQGTTVRVRHTDWERLPDAAALASEHRAGWKMHLSNLSGHLEKRAQS